MACFVWKFAQGHKGNVLRKKRHVRNTRQAPNVSTTRSPSHLVSTGRCRMPTASSLYLTWLPPQYPLASLSPKTTYPTVRDIPTWLRVTPVSEVFGETYLVPSQGPQTDIYDANATNPAANPPRRPRPEDLHLNSPIHRKATAASSLNDRNPPGITPRKNALPCSARQAKADRRHSRGQGKRMRVIINLNKPLPAIPQTSPSIELFSNIGSNVVCTTGTRADVMIQVGEWI